MKKKNGNDKVGGHVPPPFCAAFSPPAMMFINGLKDGVTIDGLGNAFKHGQQYLVLGLGVLSDGTVLALTKGDNGNFMWLSEEECNIGVVVPQAQASPILVPGVPGMHGMKRN